MASPRRSSRRAAWPRRSWKAPTRLCIGGGGLGTSRRYRYYYLGQDEGASGPPLELQRVVFSHVAKTPDLRARMAATMKHELSPQETLPVLKVLGWTLGAALRGSPRVIPQFLAVGKRGAAINRELRLRRRLLAEAEEARRFARERQPAVA